MTVSLGSVTNNYTLPIAVQAFVEKAANVDFAATHLSGGHINVVIPLRGTLSIVDQGKTVGGTPPNAVEVFFLDKTWSFRYETDLKLNVTIDAKGNPTPTKA